MDMMEHYASWELLLLQRLVDEEYILHCHLTYIKSNCPISSWKNSLWILMLKSVGQTGSCFCGIITLVNLKKIWASLPLLVLCLQWSSVNKLLCKFITLITLIIWILILNVKYLFILFRLFFKTSHLWEK